MVKKTIIIKKKWYTILAPKLFNEQPVGETYLADGKSAIGREISVSLMTITNDPQKQNIYVRFLITGFSEETLTTEPIGYKLNSAGIKRLMRRRKSKIEDSFVAETEDKKKVRIKPILVTRSRAQSGAMSALHKELRLKLIKKINEMKFENFLKELVMKKVQRAVSDELKKIFPVGILEIKELKIILPKK